MNGIPLVPGCCSAISPCSYQQAHPEGLCETCKAAVPAFTEGRKIGHADLQTEIDVLNKLAFHYRKESDDLRKENMEMKEEIKKVHKTWFTGADLDYEAISQACMQLFRFI